MITRYDVVFKLKEIQDIKDNIKKRGVVQRSIPITVECPKCNKKFNDALVIKHFSNCENIATKHCIHCNAQINYIAK